MKKFLLIAIATVFALSCDKADESKPIQIIVASEKGTGSVVSEFPCYIVKFAENGPWTTITESIIGFDYQPGYEYVLLVRKKHIKNPPQDYLGEYVLVKLISKTLKE